MSQDPARRLFAGAFCPTAIMLFLESRPVCARKRRVVCDVPNRPDPVTQLVVS